VAGKMNIVAVLGSPRLKGNSSFIAGRFLRTAKALGAATRTFELNKLSYRGCQACEACKKKAGMCSLEDGLKPALEAVREADVLLLASPIYYGDLSSQLKGFIDRTYGFFTPGFRANGHKSRLPSGKTLVFVLTQGASPKHFEGVFERYAGMLKYHGFTRSFLIRACELVGPRDARSHKELLKLADKAATEIISSRRKG